MFNFGFGMSREWFGSLVRDLLWYDGGNASNNYSNTSGGSSNNESDDNSDILLGNLPIALPSPFEPQSETVLGTAILGIDSVEDKSHSRQFDYSRNSARHGVISGSEQYELVINTNDETDNPNVMACNNSDNNKEPHHNISNNNYDDCNAKESIKHHTTKNNNFNNDDDEDEEDEEQNARCTNSNKRQRQTEKTKTHEINNENKEEEEEEEELEKEEEEHQHRNQYQKRATETAPQHSVPLLISVTSSANTDTESNTIINNANDNNNNNVLPVHTQLASSSVSMFSPLPVIPRFPSLSLMTDNNHSNTLQNNNYNYNNCNENINTPLSNIHHNNITETQQHELPILRSSSSSEFESSLSLHSSAQSSLEPSEQIIPLRSWQSRMLGLCGLRSRTRHRDYVATNQNNSNSSYNYEENANRRGSRDYCSDSNNNSDNNRTSQEREDVMDTYNVLNGGYVVFTDDYVKAHPNSTISIITSAYKSLNDSDNGNENKEPVNLLEQNIRRSKLQEVRKCIAEVQGLQRPLFKRRNSDVIYGRASYHTRCEDSIRKADDETTNSETKNNENCDIDHHIIVDSETGSDNNNEQEEDDDDKNNIVKGDDDGNKNVYNTLRSNYWSHEDDVCKNESSTTNIV